MTLKRPEASDVPHKTLPRKSDTLIVSLRRRSVTKVNPI